MPAHLSPAVSHEAAPAGDDASLLPTVTRPASAIAGDARGIAASKVAPSPCPAVDSNLSVTADYQKEMPGRSDGADYNRAPDDVAATGGGSDGDGRGDRGIAAPQPARRADTGGTAADTGRDHPAGAATRREITPDFSRSLFNFLTDLTNAHAAAVRALPEATVREMAIREMRAIKARGGRAA